MRCAWPETREPTSFSWISGCPESTGAGRTGSPLAATGLSNDEIADDLHLSPLTAKTHISRAMTKLGARDRAQLVVMTYESGLVGPAGPTRG